MGNKMYKIAIMGAKGAGKTMFLGSYFNLAIYKGTKDKKQLKYEINTDSLEKDEDGYNEIDRLIKSIFGNEGGPAAPTSGRKNFSFSVNNGMDIELWDVEGGSTTNELDIKNETGEISDDLKQADGVIFFIPADELYEDVPKVYQDNRTFIDSIKLIQRSDKGRYADIPICFVLTKCDKLPEGVEQEDLINKMIGLFNEASKESSDRGNNWIERKLKEKRIVKTYMSKSMGAWPDEEHPPVRPPDYAPENVLEPMNEMFKAMKCARGAFRRMIIKAACVLCLLFGGAIFVGAYYYDSSNGQKARSEVQDLVQKNDFESALKVLDEFETPWGIDKLIPNKLKAANGLNALRIDVYAAWEANLYSKIKPSIDRANNMNDRVRADIQAYLDHTEFPQIAPDHYKEVSDSLGRFKIADIIANAPDGSKDPDEIMDYIKRLLGVDTAGHADWKKMIDDQVDVMIYNWSATMPSLPTVAVYEYYIATAEQLSAHPKASENLKASLNDLSGRWRTDRDTKGLKAAIDEIRKTRSLEGLFSVYESLDKLRSHTEVLREINGKIQGITTDELQKIKTDLESSSSKGDFAAGKRLVSQRCGELRSTLQKFQDNNIAISSISNVDSMESDGIAELHGKHLGHCKQLFTSSKSTTDRRKVQVCIDTLNEYLMTWQDASSANDSSQVRNVIAYLKAIQNGVEGILKLKGNFAAISTWRDTPDMKVVMRLGDEIFETGTIDNNDSPSWDIGFKWDLAMSDIGIKCVEDNALMSETLIISESINASGLIGYQYLDRTLSGKGCTLILEFNPSQSIPPCPW